MSKSLRTLVLLILTVQCYKADSRLVISSNRCIPSKDSFVKLLDVSVDECVNACVRRHTCKSLGYRRRLKLCELHKETVLSTHDDEDSSCFFIERKDMDQTNTSNCNCTHVGHVCNLTSGQCEIAECGQLDLSNGNVYGNRHYIGAKRQVSCKKGFVEPRGIKTVSCNGNGEWDPTPICEADETTTVAPPPTTTTKTTTTTTTSSTTTATTPAACDLTTETQHLVKTQEYHCPDGINYAQFDLHDEGVRVDNRTSIIFETKGKNDAHILLQTVRNDYSSNVVEIVLGGWVNTLSVIRSKPQGQEQNKFSGTVLDPNSYKPFWISWNNSCVQVGNGSNVGRNVFMSWCGVNYNIASMRISYGFGSEGYFKFAFRQSLSYVGCYVDDASRLLNLIEYIEYSKMTTAMCSEHCYGNGMRFSLTEVGVYCYCGKALNNTYERRPDSECYFACAGNSNETCGGPWRGSVYDALTLDLCPGGWLRYMYSCYYFSSDKMTWQDALLQCRNQGGTLVEINDASENSFLVENAKTIQESFWIGLFYQVAAENYVWEGSQSVLQTCGFSDWYDRNRDYFYATKMCSYMNYKFGFKWDNIDCESLINFICEK